MKDNFETNIEDTINSGQVFLWKKINSKWYGINGKKTLILEDKLDVKSREIHNFFRYDDDFQKIKKQLSKDNVMKKAISNFPGMRILRQDPFQCYISFIVSSNSNIPNIQTRLQKLSQRFGERKMIDGMEFFLFPKPEKLANASITDIAKCGLGYRTKYVKKASIAVDKGMINFSSLKKLDYQEARDSLCQVFVLDDGGEADLDLGNYERFLDVNLSGSNSSSSGQIYQEVIHRERSGQYYEGKTVQAG